MTKEEYIRELKSYINSKMEEIQNDGTRHTLTFWANFNREKEVEFKAQLEEKGIVVEQV